MNQESSTATRTWRNWMSAAALGAVTMYFSDPDKGRRRRALARDKIRKFMTKTADALDVTTHDLSNRMHGLRAQAGRMLSARRPGADDQLLVERVRSTTGHAVSHPHPIKVSAQHGRVTLSGPILASEVEQLLNAVRQVPGVAAIENNLEIHDKPDIPALQGQGRRRQLRPLLLQENWPPALRATAALGGGALGYYALRRRSPASLMLGALGMGLMMRGMINMPLKRAAGIDVQKPLIDLQKSIYIAAPRETVFDIWSNYENFPHFMSHVQKVQDLGNGRSHWVVNGPAGAVVEWNAVLTECTRPEILAWKSEPDSPVQHAGRVRFEPADDGVRVHVQMSYIPPAGILGHAVASLFDGDPKKQLEEDLLRMKTFIESGIPPRDAAKPLRQPGTILH